MRMVARASVRRMAAEIGLLLGLLALAGLASAEPAPLIPLEDFFRNPDMVAHQLSPDGKHIAFLKPWESRLNVHVQETGSDTIVRVTEAKQRDIVGFAWASDDRLVYIQDTGGDENWRAYAVGADGSNPKDLTPFPGVQVQIVDALDDDDDHMLISMNKRDARIFDVYRISIVTGEMEMIAENPGNISSWITDHAGRLRVAVTADGVNTSLLYRKAEADTFRTLLTTSFKDALQPLFFTFDDQQLYVSSNLDRDKQAIYRFDPETAKSVELIYEHPEVDVETLLRSKHRKVITGVSFNAERRGYHFFDKERAELQKLLESKLPGYDVGVASMSDDETKVLAVSYSDRSYGTYWFLDRSTGEFKKIADISPWIDESKMAAMQPVTYRSRDGLKIPAHLTLPVGVEPKNLPVIVLPHGGPWWRDSWGFNPEVQFLANRGYAVLQPNFRGSTGHGKAFWQASFKEWGKKMQDDITDGAKWLIAEGIADPKRIGIYGASYGGYATLAGLAFTPDLYACGVSYVGVSNMFTFLESFPPYWELGRKMIYEMVGDPEKDKDLLTAASPFFHADKIRAPLLVAQGANDPRVKKAESDQIVEALRGRGIDVPYIVKDNEGHGFLLEENRFEVYRAMEGFFAKHLGGRVG